MADGSKKRIDEIKIDDIVKTFNGQAKVKFIEKSDFIFYYKITHAKGILFVTEEHPFPIGEKLKAINPDTQPGLGLEKLETGDSFITSDGLSLIFSIEKMPDRTDVYSIILEDEFTSFVDNVVVISLSWFFYHLAGIFTGNCYSRNISQVYGKLEEIYKKINEQDRQKYQEYFGFIVSIYNYATYNSISDNVYKLYVDLKNEFIKFFEYNDITITEFKSIFDNIINIVEVFKSEKQ
jgi:hypothetical protein